MNFHALQLIHEERVRELEARAKHNHPQSSHGQNKMLNKVGKLFVKVGQNLQDLSDNHNTQQAITLGRDNNYATPKNI